MAHPTSSTGISADCADPSLSDRFKSERRLDGASEMSGMRRTVHKNFLRVAFGLAHTLLISELCQNLICSFRNCSLMYRAAAHDTALLLGGNAICTCEPSDLFLGLPGVIQPLSKAFQALSLSFLELSTVSALATTACLCQQGLATASIIPVSMPITSMQCLCSHSSWTPGAKFFSTDIRSSCGIKSTANCL